ncbi:MAG: 6,7-dimethyl-8-ribityllumazine synthase [Candidatus Planktophila sp.]
MAGHAPEVAVKEMPGAKVAIITATWHEEICLDLVAGAQRACALAKVSTTVINVPGSFELPLAAQLAFEQGFDAAVVLGVVIQGETPHFDYVCQGVTQGVMDVSLKFSKPIGFGVLTVNTIEQAIARCGRPESFEDKGFDSAVAALTLLLQK